MKIDAPARARKIRITTKVRHGVSLNGGMIPKVRWEGAGAGTRAMDTRTP